MIGSMHLIWIIAGEDYNTHTYVRLHVQPMVEHLRGLGHVVGVHFQEHAWTSHEIAVESTDCLVLVKTEEYGGRRSRFTREEPDTRLMQIIGRAQASGTPLVAVHHQLLSPASHALKACPTWVVAWADQQMKDEARRLGRRLLITPDPWDPGVPTKLERARVQGELAQARQSGDEDWMQLVTIARRRHLGALAPYAAAVQGPWTLTVLTDEPEGDQLQWSPERAHELVCAADALLVIASDGVSAPIRLLNGLRCGCPVLATPLPSYIDEAPVGAGWLAIENPDELSGLLAQFADDPTQLVDLSARSALWQGSAPDLIANWTRVIEHVAGRTL